ncbi:hypothetical protein C804_03862 [Lachnospiraceae bacterium A4]|jgi:hypothetical protein|nr:hypothetical protein C804_03862 [Lachnospiraceae bacterium A4]
MIKGGISRRFPEREALFYFFREEEMMNDLKKKPCHKCPYTLGLIQTVKNPCPQCMVNGYQSYQWFQKQLSGKCPDSKKKK